MNSRLQRLDVAERIDRLFRVRHIGVLEGAHDVDERVGLREVAEQCAADPLLAHALRQPRDIDVLHIRGDDALRLEHRRQAVQPLIRHLDGREVRFIFDPVL